MIVAEVEEEAIPGSQVEKAVSDAQIQGAKYQSMELHLYSTVGITCPNTMKLKGTLLGQNIVILIDSGVSHNFISSKLVEDLNITVTPIG